MTTPVKLMPLTKEDKPFIYNSWLKSCRQYHGYLSSTTYHMWQHRMIEMLLKTATTRVMLSPDGGIVGYICYSVKDECIHWIYIKGIFRGFNFAKQMIGTCCPNAKYYTHVSVAWAKIAPQLDYNPFILALGRREDGIDMH